MSLSHRQVEKMMDLFPRCECCRLDLCVLVSVPAGDGGTAGDPHCLAQPLPLYHSRPSNMVLVVAVIVAIIVSTHSLAVEAILNDMCLALI